MNFYKIVIGLESAEAGHINAEAVIADMTMTFKGFTLTRTEGFWEGKYEESLSFEVATEYSFALMRRIAARLAERYCQESVMVVSLGASVAFMEPPEKMRKQPAVVRSAPFNSRRA